MIIISGPHPPLPSKKKKPYSSETLILKINVSETSMKVRHGSKTPPPPFAMDFLFSETLNLLNRP